MKARDWFARQSFTSAHRDGPPVVLPMHRIDRTALVKQGEVIEIAAKLLARYVEFPHEGHGPTVLRAVAGALASVTRDLLALAEAHDAKP